MVKCKKAWPFKSMAFVRETTVYGKSVARTFPTYHWVINHDIMSGFLSPGQEKNFSYVVMKPSSYNYFLKEYSPY